MRKLKSNPTLEKFREVQKKDAARQKAARERRRNKLQNELDRELSKEMRTGFRRSFSGMGRGKLRIHKWLREKGIT